MTGVREAARAVLSVLSVVALGACSSGTTASRNQDAGADAAQEVAPSGGDVTTEAGTDASVIASRAEKACRDAITAQCERRAVCQGQSPAGCGDVPYPCPDYY